MQKQRNIRTNGLILNWAVRCYSMDNFFFICNFTGFESITST